MGYLAPSNVSAALWKSERAAAEVSKKPPPIAFLTKLQSLLSPPRSHFPSGLPSFEYQLLPQAQLVKLLPLDNNR